MSRATRLSRNGALRRVQRIGGRLRRRLAPRGGEVGPVLVNSVPKAGTNLVLQLLGGSDALTDYHQFIATRPSFTWRPRSDAWHRRQIQGLVPGELAGGHIEWTEERGALLRSAGVRMVLVVRDPRDIVVSEAHYLAEMNRWHRLSRVFARIESEGGRIDLAIDGDPEHEYPPVGDRLKWYLPWVAQADAVVRFEDVRNDPEGVFRSLAVQLGLGDGGFKPSSVDPRGSPTFRRGTAGGWREVLSEAQLHRIHQLTHELVRPLGYAGGAGEGWGSQL